jgi:hypothetical protein
VTFLLSLDPLPIDQYVLRAGDLRLPKHVRVPPFQLGHNMGNDVSHLELIFFNRYLRVQQNLQQEIAQLFPQQVNILFVQGLQDFVGLLQEEWTQRAVRLFSIPWTAPRSAQSGHYLLESRQGTGLAKRRHEQRSQVIKVSETIQLVEGHLSG